MKVGCRADVRHMLIKLEMVVKSDAEELDMVSQGCILYQQSGWKLNCHGVMGWYQSKIASVELDV